MMSKLIATADWHLGKRQYSLYRREQDFYIAAKKMIESLEEGSIVLNAGDIFDTNRPKFEAIKVLYEINDILIKAKAKMFYIEGNHDRSPIKDEEPGVKHWAGVLNQDDCEYGLKHIKSGKFYNIDEDKVLMGFCEQPKLELIEKLSNIDYSFKDEKKMYVLMLHMSCKEFASFSSESILSLNEIPNLDFWDYIIIGDTHVHKAIQINNTCIMSPGSIEMVSSSEDENKFIYEIIDKQNYMSKRIKTRPCYKFTIDNREITSEFVDKIKSISDQHPLVYLNVPVDIIGLNRIMECFNLDQAIVRIKFKKLVEEITNKEVNVDTDEILGLKDFMHLYIDSMSTHGLFDTEQLDYIQQLSTTEDIDVKEILTKLKP